MHWQNYQLHGLLCRCISNGITIQVAIAESLQSSVQVEDKVAPLARNHAGSGNRWPVWRKNGAEEAGHFYTIRVVKGQRQVVKRRSAEWQVPPPPPSGLPLQRSTASQLNVPALCDPCCTLLGLLSEQIG